MRYPVNPLLWLWPPMWPFMALMTVLWALAHWAVWVFGLLGAAALWTALLAGSPPAPAAGGGGASGAMQPVIPYVLLAMLWALALGGLALWVAWARLAARKRAQQALLWRQRQELQAWQWRQYQAWLADQACGLAGPGMPPAS